MFFKKQKLALGVDIGSHSIKIAEVEDSPHGLVLKNFGMAPVPRLAIVEGVVKERAQVADIIATLVKNLKTKSKRTATSIAGYSVIIKKINLPLMSEKELENNIAVEASQYIPFDINDVYIDFQILGTSEEKKDRMDVMLVAAKRETIDEYSELLREADLIPAIIDADPFALENAYEFSYDTGDQNIALVDIGASKININILVNGVSNFTRDASYGGDQITEQIQSKFNLPYDQSETLKISGDVEADKRSDLTEIFSSNCSLWTMEIRRAIDFYYANYPDRSLAKIVLSGGSAKIAGLSDILSRETDIPVEIFDPFARLDVDPDRFDTEYVSQVGPQAAIAIGLALRSVET